MSFAPAASMRCELRPLVGGQVVHHGDVAPRQGRNQHLLDIDEEYAAVHGAVVDEGRGHAGEPERAGEGRGLPITMRHAGPAALAAWRSSTQARLFVFRPVSSMNTSLAGSMSSWPLNQARRRFRMSGRSCSSACADFSKRPAAATKPGAQGTAADAHRLFDYEPLHHLVQRDVLALLDHPDDERFMRVEAGCTASTLSPRCAFADLRPCNPTDRARHAYAKPCCQ